MNKTTKTRATISILNVPVTNWKERKGSVIKERKDLEKSFILIHRPIAG